MADILDIARERLELLCREYREQNGDLSEAKLARKMSYSPQKLGKLLSLQVRIGLKEAEHICNFFDVSIAWLTGESEMRQRLTPEMQSAMQQLFNSKSS